MWVLNYKFLWQNQIPASVAEPEPKQRLKTAAVSFFLQRRCLCYIPSTNSTLCGIFIIWSNFLQYLEEQSLEITGDGEAGQCDILFHVNRKLKSEMIAISEQLLGSHFCIRD